MAAASPDDLKPVPLFADLDNRQLKKLAARFRERTVRPGTKVTTEGEMSGVGFFVVASGEAAGNVGGQDVPTLNVGGKDVTTLGPGAPFGEIALVSEAVRTATVTATSELRLLEIPFWD